MTKQQAGKLGAEATRAKYGELYTQHMSEIGKIGYQVTVSKYDRLPCNLAQWCLVRKGSTEVVAVW